MKIVFGTLKGGAGKTMNAFNIGGLLAEKKKVLLIDVDPQCNLTNNCGVDITDRNSLSIKDIFENNPKEQPKADDIIVKAPIEELPKLDIIPSSIFLFQTESTLYTKADRVGILQKYMKSQANVFDTYDYIIIDTNPSMSFININAFVIADHIILSCDVSNNSLTGAELFCQLWDERRDELGIEDNIDALLISNYDGRSNLAKDLVEFTGTGTLKDLILKSMISNTVKLKECEVAHKPINVYSPKHKACEQYRAVIKELKKGGVL